MVDECKQRWIDKNKEYLREYLRQYRQDNKERIKQVAHARYLETRGKDRQRQEKHEYNDVTGIYGIECKATNQWYVGQSVHVLKRLREHTRHLLAGDHYNAKLQDVFNQFGVTAFNFTVLHECSLDDLDFFEHKYISRFNSVEQGMNLYTPTPDDL